MPLTHRLEYFKEFFSLINTAICICFEILGQKTLQTPDLKDIGFFLFFSFFYIKPTTTCTCMLFLFIKRKQECVFHCNTYTCIYNYKFLNVLFSFFKG